MRKGQGLILRAAQERYLDRMLPPRDRLLTEMESLAAAEDIPISDPEVGRLLEVLARSTRPRRILEIGTAIGYGTFCLARGASDARVLTIDSDPERLERARDFLGRAGVLDRVDLLLGPALEVIPTVTAPLDLVFVDAVKPEYRRYLDLVLPKMAVGGTLVFDGLLRGGRVAEPPDLDQELDEDDADEAKAEALRSFNGYLMIHPQLASVILPMSDGVGLATKVKPLISEMGGPF
jgi:caffeoyl-CoA O-methyltransferase